MRALTGAVVVLAALSSCGSPFRSDGLLPASSLAQLERAEADLQSKCGLPEATRARLSPSDRASAARDVATMVGIARAHPDEQLANPIGPDGPPVPLRGELEFQAVQVSCGEVGFVRSLIDAAARLPGPSSLPLSDPSAISSLNTHSNDLILFCGNRSKQYWSHPALSAMAAARVDGDVTALVDVARGHPGAWSFLGIPAHQGRGADNHFFLDQFAKACRIPAQLQRLGAAAGVPASGLLIGPVPPRSGNWPLSSDTDPRGSIHLALASPNATVPHLPLIPRA